MEKFLELVGPLTFSFHLTLWYAFQNYNKTNCPSITKEELSLRKKNVIKKSDSEYSLGLNRSESIAASLNQFGSPCFMSWTAKDFCNILIFDNIDSIFVIMSSIALVYYTMYKKNNISD